MVAKGDVVGERWTGSLGLADAWINNKILLYSTGKYIQYLVVNHNAEECEKICITEPFGCTTEISAIL